MLPPYDSLATLADLTALAETLRPREIWCLGDSFHDDEGCDRLPDAAQARLRALTGAIAWTWITGNMMREWSIVAAGSLLTRPRSTG